jgi:hypothetical protein
MSAATDALYRLIEAPGASDTARYGALWDALLAVEEAEADRAILPDPRIKLAAQTLRNEIHQLEAWADASSTGGWSTHQVKPMRERAIALSRVLVELL